MDVTIPKQENGLIEVTEPDSVSFADPAQAQMPVEQEVPVQWVLRFTVMQWSQSRIRSIRQRNPCNPGLHRMQRLTSARKTLLKNAMNTRRSG